MKCSRVLFDFVCWLAVVGSASGSGLYGRVQNLSFVPDAATKPQDKHDIPEPALFQFLLDEEIMEQLDEAGAEIPEMLDVLKDLDKESEITEFEIYQINRTGKVADLKKVAFHTFVVFKTTSETEGDDWWSLEKNHLDTGLVLQRSGNKGDVKNKLYGVERINVEPIQKGLKGKGTVQDLFVLLWSHQVIGKNSDFDDSYCQTFVTLLSQQMTEIGYEYQGDFECSSPLENGRKTRLLNIINYLSDVTEWRSIQIFNYLENADLVDQVLDELKMKCGKFDIDELRSVITFALHFAIMFSKTKMVGHLLKPPHSADPTRSGIDGMDALRIAGTFAKDPEIFDLLLAHDNIKIDRVDREGETALHAAASTSNVVAVKHLINKGAHPNIVDKNGTSPLRLAAQKRDGNPIIDLLLEAQKVKGMGDVNDQDKRGWTTLHHAALASNEITAEHLIQKGADLNRRADDEYTPLHVAAIFAKNMNIIDVLLKNVKNEDINTNYAATILASAKRNMHGLGDQIVARLKAKGIVGIDESKITETDVEMIRLLIEIERYIGTKTLGENGMNLLHSASFHAKTTDVIDIILETGEFDINGGDNDGLTPLHYALLGLYPKRNVAHLIQLGADPNVADKNGVTALNMAARNAESMHLIELLLLNREPVGVGYCDKQEYYFYPTSNVCRVNS